MKSELPGASKGLFATKPIPRGSVIAKYTGDVVITMDPDYGNPYALKIDDNPPTFIDASRTNTAEGRWVNDARNEADENAELHYDKATKRGYLEATRDIAAGEEIYTDYGEDYWLNKPTIPNLKGRRALLSSREKRSHAVKEVVELQEDNPQVFPEVPVPPRVRKHIMDEPEPEYIDVPKVRKERKPREKREKREKAPQYSKYNRDLVAKLRMMQLMLKNEKFVEQLKLKPSKKSFDIPEEGVAVEWLKQLEATEKKAMKQLLAHFNTGPTKMTEDKLESLIIALLKRDPNRKKRLQSGDGFDPYRGIFNQ